VRRLNGWGILPALAVALAMLAMFLVAGDQGLPLRLESEMLDLRFRSWPPRPHRVPVVIVEIDDASIDSARGHERDDVRRSWPDEALDMTPPRFERGLALLEIGVTVVDSSHAPDRT
jgi:CHASE2 domain-containing sensor protein